MSLSVLLLFYFIFSQKFMMCNTPTPTHTHTITRQHPEWYINLLFFFRKDRNVDGAYFPFFFIIALQFHTQRNFDVLVAIESRYQLYNNNMKIKTKRKKKIQQKNHFFFRAGGIRIWKGLNNNLISSESAEERKKKKKADLIVKVNSSCIVKRWRAVLYDDDNDY